MKRRTISTDEYQFALSIFEREFPPRDIITITDETGLSDRPYVRPTIDGHIRINIGKLYDKCLDSDANKALFAHELTRLLILFSIMIPTTTHAILQKL